MIDGRSRLDLDGVRRQVVGHDLQVVQRADFHERCACRDHGLALLHPLEQLAGNRRGDRDGAAAGRLATRNQRGLRGRGLEFGGANRRVGGGHGFAQAPDARTELFRHVPRPVARVEQRLRAGGVRFRLLQLHDQALPVGVRARYRRVRRAHARLAGHLRAGIERHRRGRLYHGQRLPLAPRRQDGFQSAALSRHRCRHHEPPPQPCLAFLVDRHPQRRTHDIRGFHVDNLRAPAPATRSPRR